MPLYRFVGPFETVLHGLSHEVNALLHRHDGNGEPLDHGQPPGSTLVAQPGDQVETEHPYPNANLINVDTGKPDDPEPEPTEPAAEPTPEPAAEPDLVGAHAAPAVAIVHGGDYVVSADMTATASAELNVTPTITPAAEPAPAAAVAPVPEPVPAAEPPAAPAPAEPAPATPTDAQPAAEPQPTITEQNGA